MRREPAATALPERVGRVRAPSTTTVAMSAAAERNLLLCLESLEPDLRAAGERAARRVGMELDDWIALKLRDRAARGSGTRPPEGERAATVGASGALQPAAEPAPDDGPEGTPAAPGRGDAQSRRGRIDLDALLALRDAVEEIRLALKNPRPVRSDPETARQLRSILAKLETIEKDRRSLDLSATARRVEGAAQRLGELADRDRDGAAAVARQVADLAHRLRTVAERAESRDEPGSVAKLLEALHARLQERERAGSDLLDRTERLAEKLEGMAQDHASSLARSTERLHAAASAPVSDHSAVLQSLVERLDRVDERLREGRSRDEERLRSVEAMLRAAVERLGEAGRPVEGAETLDALERQVGRLARLLDAPRQTDPALASLQRAMDGLLARIGALGDGALQAAEPAVEVPAALDRLPLQGPPETGLIGTDRGDPKHLAGAADAPAENTLVRREPDATASPVDPSGRALPDGEGRPPATATEAALPEGDAERSPSASRADRSRTIDPAVGEIKAGLIAAARRAAQVVSGEAAANGPGGGAAPATRALSDAEVASARLKSVVERPRRPLIPALAAAIPAIGSRLLAGREPGTVAADPARPKAAAERRRPETLLPAANEPPPAGEWTDAGSGLKKAAGVGI